MFSFADLCWKSWTGSGASGASSAATTKPTALVRSASTIASNAVLPNTRLSGDSNSLANLNQACHFRTSTNRLELRNSKREWEKFLFSSLLFFSSLAVAKSKKMSTRSLSVTCVRRRGTWRNSVPTRLSTQKSRPCPNRPSNPCATNVVKPVTSFLSEDSSIFNGNLFSPQFTPICHSLLFYQFLTVNSFVKHKAAT